MFGNCTNDSSDGGFGRDEGAGPSNVPGRDGIDDSDDKEDPEEDLKEESDGDKTQEKGVVHASYIELES